MSGLSNGVERGRSHLEKDHIALPRHHPLPALLSGLSDPKGDSSVIKGILFLREFLLGSTGPGFQRGWVDPIEDGGKETPFV